MAMPSLTLHPQLISYSLPLSRSRGRGGDVVLIPHIHVPLGVPSKGARALLGLVRGLRG